MLKINSAFENRYSITQNNMTILKGYFFYTCRLRMYQPVVQWIYIAANLMYFKNLNSKLNYCYYTI